MGLPEKLIIAQIQKPRVFMVEVKGNSNCKCEHELFEAVVEGLEKTAVEIEKRGGRLFFSGGNRCFFESETDIGMGVEVAPSALEPELENTKKMSVTGQTPMQWANFEEEALKGIELSAEEVNEGVEMLSGKKDISPKALKHFQEAGLASGNKLTELGVGVFKHCDLT
jgi:hypothetical protein